MTYDIDASSLSAPYKNRKQVMLWNHSIPGPNQSNKFGSKGAK